MVEQLQNVNGSVGNITDMARRIAVAVDQQSSVVSEISSNLLEIREMAEISRDSTAAAETCDSVKSMANDMEELAGQFWNKRILN
ncbi:MAG: hypothetical protein OFPI_13350 [Osedax symbiont Rs2]|nr:MAG: hypothetical protein OFPI_13350 [Osedax symbiont Rs2]